MQMDPELPKEMTVDQRSSCSWSDTAVRAGFKMADIHPTAIIDPDANLAPDVSVGPYAVIEAGVTVGAGCRLAAQSVVLAGSVLEEGVSVHSFAVIGGLPQDLSFDPAVLSGVRIGAGTTIREHATVHRSTRAGNFTMVGAHCFLMAGAHVGHDSEVGEHVILANNVLLAGHSHVGSWCFFGGAAAMHQHVRIGEGTMVGGMARISQDVPPFCMVTERNHLSGLNLVGLRRRGVQREVIRELKLAFHTVYDGAGNRRSRALEALNEQAPEHWQARTFLEFFLTGKRGFVDTKGA